MKKDEVNQKYQQLVRKTAKKMEKLESGDDGYETFVLVTQQWVEGKRARILGGVSLEYALKMGLVYVTPPTFNPLEWKDMWHWTTFAHDIFCNEFKLGISPNT